MTIATTLRRLTERPARGHTTTDPVCVHYRYPLTRAQWRRFNRGRGRACLPCEADRIDAYLADAWTDAWAAVGRQYAQLTDQRALAALTYRDNMPGDWTDVRSDAAAGADR